MQLTDKIVSELRRQGVVSLEHLVDTFSPSRHTTHPQLRERRRMAMVKAISRARLRLLTQGETIVNVPVDGVARAGFALASLERRGA